MAFGLLAGIAPGPSAGGADLLQEQLNALLPTCQSASSQPSEEKRTSYLERYAGALKLDQSQRDILNTICAAYDQGVRMKPPYEDARKAPDGAWYIKRGKKLDGTPQFYRIDQ